MSVREFELCLSTTFEKVIGLQEPPKGLRIARGYFDQFQKDRIICYGRDMDDGSREYLTFFGPPKKGREANSILAIAAPNKKRGLDLKDVINDHEMLLRYKPAKRYGGEKSDFELVVEKLIEYHQKMRHWSEYAKYAGVMIDALSGRNIDGISSPALGIVPFLYWRRDIYDFRQWIANSPTELVQEIANWKYGLDVSQMVPVWGPVVVAGVSPEVTKEWPKTYPFHGPLGQILTQEIGPNQAAMYSLMKVDRILNHSKAIQGLEDHIDMNMGN